MKPFLVEIKATPNNILRIQYGNDFASVAMMVQNGKLPIHGLRELNEVERHDYQRGGVQVGLQNIHIQADKDRDGAMGMCSELGID